QLMRVAYPAIFAVMLAEGIIRGAPPARIVGAGLFVFAAAKAVKWSAIVALGPAWTFRIIVVPRAPLVTRRPYRYLRPPNYGGVVGEIVGVAVITRSFVTGPAVAVIFGLLLSRRIAVEQRVLGMSEQSDVHRFSQ